MDGRNWVFATRENNSVIRLLLHCEVNSSSTDYVKVKSDKSPYDGDLIYWSSRLGKHPEMPPQKATLLKKQKGKCNWCEMFFREHDVLEVDHIIPKSKGGKNKKDNLQLLHRHCHDEKTASDGNLRSDQTKRGYIE